MKKIIAVLILVSLLLCGCGESGADTSTDANSQKPNSCTQSGMDESDSADVSQEATVKEATSGKEAIEIAMQGIKDVDKDVICKYFGEDFWEWLFIGGEEEKLIREAFKSLTYEITSTEEPEADTTFAMVKIRVVDLGIEYLKVAARMRDYDQQMELAEITVTPEARRNELFRIFHSELTDTDSYTYSEGTIEMQAYLRDDGWSLSRSDALVRVLFGTPTYINDGGAW